MMSNKKKNIPVEIFQGGSTGLVQQKRKQPLTRSRPKVGIVKGIKDVLKSEFKCDRVLIQVGSFIEVIEEDAKYFEDEFGLKIHDAGGNRAYDVTGFPKSGLDKYLKKLDERKVCYCLVEQVDVGEKKVTREVTSSSCDKKAIGLVF